MNPLEKESPQSRREKGAGTSSGPGANVAELVLSANPEVAVVITRLHQQIMAATRATLQNAIRVGELLSQTKASLKHGQWLGWLELNINFDVRTAQRYMRIFERREELKNDSVSYLTQAYVLLAQHPTEVDQGVAGERLEALDRQLSGSLPGLVEIWTTLQEIRDRGLYRQSHDRFETYCHQRWGLSPELLEVIAIFCSCSGAASLWEGAFEPVSRKEGQRGVSTHEDRPNWAACWARKKPAAWSGACDCFGVVRIAGALYWCEVWNPSWSAAAAGLGLRLSPKDGIGARSARVTLRATLADQEQQGDYNGQLVIPEQGPYVVQAWAKQTRRGTSFWHLHFQSNAATPLAPGTRAATTKA
jgi:hypothetical protein